MLSALLQDNSGSVASEGVALIFILISFLIGFAVFLVMLASLWKIFVKMGDPGWMGIIPFLNVYRVFQRSRPNDASVLTIVSIVCGFVSLVACWDLAKLFGKSGAYAVGLIFLPIIFMPMLAFGDSQYQGPQIAAL